MGRSQPILTQLGEGKEGRSYGVAPFFLYLPHARTQPIDHARTYARTSRPYPIHWSGLDPVAPRSTRSTPQTPDLRPRPQTLDPNLDPQTWT